MLAASAFVAGMSVMAIEITASRLLAPYFGASMFVWTSLIVTVLLALSFGYWAGGAVAEKNGGVRALAWIMVGSGALLLAALAIIAHLSPALLALIAGWRHASIGLFLGSLVAAFSAFALPVFMLAMASPIIMKEWIAAGGDVGKVSGRYFAVSTLGSVVGTVAPTLAVVPAFGARHTIEIAAGLLLAFGLALMPTKRVLLAAFLVPGTGLSFLIAPAASPNVIAATESPYQLIRIVQSEAKRYMIFNEGTGIQSVYDPSGAPTGFYYDYYGVLPLLRPYAAGHRAAILGLAGGTIASTYGAMLPRGAPRPELVGVEVDAAVIAAAREYMALDAAGVETVNLDARVFLATQPEKFDVIIVDAYSTQLYIAPHLVTREFFSLAESRLAPGGIIALNVNAAADDSPLLTTLLNTVAAEFDHVAYVPVGNSWNYLVVASVEPFDLAGAGRRLPAGFEEIAGRLSRPRTAFYDALKPVFTDDRAPVEMMTDAMILKEALQNKEAES